MFCILIFFHLLLKKIKQLKIKHITLCTLLKQEYILNCYPLLFVSPFLTYIHIYLIQFPMSKSLMIVIMISHHFVFEQFCQIADFKGEQQFKFFLAVASVLYLVINEFVLGV